MGTTSFKLDRDTLVEKAQCRAGKIAVTGRYHVPPKVFDDDYELKDTVLGTGMSGKVHLASNRLSGGKFAVKTLKFHGISEKVKQDLKSEVEVYLQLDHPQITRLVDVYESEVQMILVMECMEGGELFDRVVEKESFNEIDASDTAERMLLALNYLHCHGIIHRDVKLENFLYQRKDNDVLKLVDFGLSKVWEPDTKLKVSCGTLGYVAPEVLDKNYNTQCDLWSLGVCVFVLLSGYMPFDGSSAHQICLIKSGMYDMDDDKWRGISEEGKDFVKKLLVVNPTERMTAEQALAHPWIAQRSKLKPACPAVDTRILTALRNFALASKFRRVCLSMMAWSLTFEERTTVRAAFMELDRSRQGTVKFSDLKQVFEKEFDVTDADVLKVFEALDTNHDHEIHYSDFLSAMLASRIALHDDMLKETFRRFDISNSGYITLENLQKVLGDTFDGTTVNELLEEVDLDGDGKVSCADFMAYLRGTPDPNASTETTDKIIELGLERVKSEASTSTICPLRRRLSSELIDAGRRVRRKLSIEHAPSASNLDSMEGQDKLQIESAEVPFPSASASKE
mmetsp:Transcript_63517/g.138337  ORF Transcript_63517/g.138337 Transcript_63517/m.138337 type:complete len:567 (-) Transcript_63517:29-1729(-)